MLNVAMVGMGGISHAHRNAWKEIPEAKIIAVCDIRPEKAQEAADETGGKLYLDFDEMLNNEQIDILDICLPTYLHADFACKALERGINTLTEKPISLKREDVQRVYSTAKAHNVRFMVAQCVRFWREFVYLRECYENGTYGKLLSGCMRRLGNTPKWSWDNWMRDPERSGLVPFDLHIHDLDYIIGTFGKPEKIVCDRARGTAQDYIHAVYHFKDFFITAEAAWYDCTYRFQNGFRFQFEKAVLEYQGGKLTIYHQDGTVEELDAQNEVGGNGINLPKTNAYLNEIRYFVDCVLAGKDCEKIRPEELETVLDIIDELNKA